MISIKKYWDESHHEPEVVPELHDNGLLPAAVAAWRSTLREVGCSSLEAFPIVSDELKRGLSTIDDSLSRNVTQQKIEDAEHAVQARFKDWVDRAARHSRQKTAEVKEILLVMARTAESVGQRDQRCANSIADVTGRLKKIATLDDLSQIRTSIEESAAELKTSIERMTSEGKAAVDKLKAELNTYQARLEEAEQIAASDSMTGLRSRMWMENYIERRVGESSPFCLVIIDIDDFKSVNDAHGHPAGDELLRLFAGELKSAFRTASVVGRWGGDEFLVLLDCGLDEAKSQIARLRKWVCGSYTLKSASAPVKLNVEASIGLAARANNETAKSLLARADADMYRDKAASRARR